MQTTARAIEETLGSGRQDVVNKQSFAINDKIIVEICLR